MSTYEIDKDAVEHGCCWEVAIVKKGFDNRRKATTELICETEFKYVAVLCDALNSMGNFAPPALNRYEKVEKQKVVQRPLQEAEQAIGDLLAIIHGDGGHYIETHGWKKACEDACEEVNKMRLTIEMLRGDAHNLQEALNER